MKIYPIRLSYKNLGETAKNTLNDNSDFIATCFDRLRINLAFAALSRKDVKDASFEYCDIVNNVIPMEAINAIVPEMRYLDQRHGNTAIVLYEHGVFNPCNSYAIIPLIQIKRNMGESKSKQSKKCLGDIRTNTVIASVIQKFSKFMDVKCPTDFKHVVLFRTTYNLNADITEYGGEYLYAAIGVEDADLSIDLTPEVIIRDKLTMQRFNINGTSATDFALDEHMKRVQYSDLFRLFQEAEKLQPNYAKGAEQSDDSIK